MGVHKVENAIMKVVEFNGYFPRVEVYCSNGSKRNYKPEKIPAKVRAWMLSRETVMWDYFGIRTYTREEDLSHV